VVGVKLTVGVDDDAYGFVEGADVTNPCAAVRRADEEVEAGIAEIRSARLEQQRVVSAGDRAQQDRGGPVGEWKGVVVRRAIERAHTQAAARMISAAATS